MTKFTLKEIEDYLTSHIAGITIIDERVAFPDKLEAFHIEGEKEYYLFENTEGEYVFTDAQQHVKCTNHDETGALLSDQKFLDDVSHIILEEE